MVRMMSGPKSSTYTLTPEQRRILEEQRRIEAGKVVARATVQRNASALRHLSMGTDHEAIVAGEAMARLGNDGGYAEKVVELRHVIQETEATTAQVDTDSLSSLESAAKSTTESLKKAEQLRREIREIIFDCEKKVKADIAASLDNGFSVSFADIRPAIPNVSDELKRKRAEIDSRMEVIRRSGILSDELSAKLEQVRACAASISDEQFLKNYIAITVNPLLERCAAYAQTYQAYHEEYENLHSEYVALCELYHYVAQEVPFSEEAIPFLKKEINRIKTSAAKQAEQEYIQNALDEVMIEMGYSVIGSREVTKRNGTHFRNELYTFSEGTAVNVTYSSDGRIAMELGGLDSTDRTPTPYESNALCEEMEDFCKDFQEIERRLLARGVVLASRISLLPPDSVYAQIINTSDYQMRIQTQRFTAERHRGKASEKKTMKVE